MHMLARPSMVPQWLLSSMFCVECLPEAFPAPITFTDLVHVTTKDHVYIKLKCET